MTVFEWLVIGLVVIGFIYADYQRKETAAFKEICQKYKGEKSDKWQVEYDSVTGKLAKSFIGALWWLYWIAVIFSIAHILDMIIAHYHIKWVGEFLRYFRSDE